MTRAAWLTVVVLLMCVGALALHFAYEAVSTSLDAEHNYQAYRHVLVLLTDRMCDTSAKWPKNWNDLINRPSHIELPQWLDIDELNARVQVDFSVSREQVATMPANRFTAVIPSSPNYGVDEAWIEPLRHAAANGCEEPATEK